MAPSVSPLNWTGNKSCIYDMISGFMPEHTRYIEPCMGSAEVFMRKKPAESEIINDFNGDLTTFFRVVKSETRVQQLIGRLFVSGNSEELFKERHELLARTPNILDEVTDIVGSFRELTDEDVELAAAFYENQIYSFSSTGGSFAIVKKNIKPKLDKILAASNRLRNAIILHRDYKDVINLFACPGGFIFFDPPYRGTEFMYRKSNFDGNEHEIVFCLMNEVDKKYGGECKFLITYNNDPYIRSLAERYGFETYVQRRIHSMAQSRKKKQTSEEAPPGSEAESPKEEKKYFEELLIANYSLVKQANRNHFYYSENCEQLGLFEYNPDY